MDEVKNAIRTIILKIPKKLIFDSHFVIDQLILTDTPAYYQIIRSMPEAGPAQIHGRIAKIIKEQVDLVESVGRSWSKHIHCSAGECEAWKHK